MSYILDALKKADAERERSAVPGLHSHPAPLVMEPETGVRALGPVAWVLAALLGVLVVLLGWRLLAPGGTTAEGPPLASPSPPIARADPASAEVDGRRHHHGPDAPVSSGAGREPGTEAAGQGQSPAVRPNWPTQVPKADAPPSDGGARVAAPKASSPGSEPAARAVVAQSELPEAIRRELPHLVVGGAMYSESPRSRMVVLNGQVFHEGDQPTPETTLEEIRLKSAVLRFRGYRYLLNF
jgi:general secretion pathway protein B